MSPHAPASVVYGTTRRTHPVRARLWLGMLAIVSVLGMVYLAFGFNREDLANADPLFKLDQALPIESIVLDEPAPVAAIAQPVVVSDPTPAPAAAAPAVVVAPALAPVQPAGPSFNGMAVRPTRTIRMLVTAYCPCRICCGNHADGKTASGYSVWVNGGKMVAADTRVLPFGALVSVPGYHEGEIVPVLDRGGKIKGNRLDLLFPTHRAAKKFGKRWVTVQVYAIAD